jgi:hypothetical protein
MLMNVVKQTIANQVSKVEEKWHHPTVFKVRAVAYETFNLIASTFAGFVGSIFGVLGGTVLVGVGTILGRGSLIMHISTLFATCVVDSYSAVFEHSYHLLSKARPHPRLHPVSA